MTLKQLLYLMPEEQAVGVIFYAYGVQHSTSLDSGMTAKALLDNLKIPHLHSKIFHIYSKNGMIRIECELTE